MLFINSSLGILVDIYSAVQFSNGSSLENRDWSYTGEPIILKASPMGYAYLAVAIFAEVIATSALKASNEFTRLWPSVLVVLGYGIAFYFLSMVLKTIPVGVAYAIWSGLGIALITLVGAVVYKQVPDLPAFAGMALIVLGVIVIYCFSKTSGH